MAQNAAGRGRKRGVFMQKRKDSEKWGRVFKPEAGPRSVVNVVRVENERRWTVIMEMTM